MRPWHKLLDRLFRGLDSLSVSGFSMPEWVLGGGTALMIWTDHRMSKDIDAFVGDGQYLSYLSPRLGGESVWNCMAYDETAHYLKLRFPEGEIDFIVAAPITSLPIETRVVSGDHHEGIPDYLIRIEHPVEIALKKLHYRGAALTVRDAFDLAVVDQLYPELLRENLSLVSGRREVIVRSLESLQRPFFDRYLSELDIQPQWLDVATTTRDRISRIVEAIPN